MAANNHLIRTVILQAQRVLGGVQLGYRFEVQGYKTEYIHFGFSDLNTYLKSLLGGNATQMLVDDIKMFARKNGAKGIFVYGTMGVEDENLGKLMQRSGFELLGRNWIG
ncbi:MAG: hypothetical protein ACPGVN_05625 [Alphaproteobacteria bacterium]